MAEVNIDGLNTVQPTQHEIVQEQQEIVQEQQEPIIIRNDDIINEQVSPINNQAMDITTPNDGIKGLSAEEYNDPNKIEVTIADKDAPIVVLFGPPACGKTMTLVRLTRYLREKQYKVQPIRSFRPSHDGNYTKICDNFDVMMNQPNAANSTQNISFMLVNVSKNGRTLCQLLEAPGEYYFNPKNPKQPFPSYFNVIKSSRNRKIWTIMIEPDWADTADRQNYVDRIQLLKRNMSVRDKAIFVYNKIDLTDYLIDNSGNAHISQARKNANDLFVGVFEPFKNPTPIARWFAPYKCDFTVFQTGDYTKAADGTIMYQQGPDVYPHRLWNIIMKQIRG